MRKEYFIKCCTRMTVILLTVILLVGFSVTAWASGKLIYVSGNPNCYPMEYYSEESKQFEGYVPELLALFASEYGYRVEYLDAGFTDKRSGHLKNSQVDLISTCTEADGFSNEAMSNGITVLLGKVEYKLLFTSATGEALKADLTAFMGDFTTQQSNALLVSAAGNVVSSFGMPVFAILCAGVCILLVAVTVLLALLKKKSFNHKEKETDLLTGIGNFGYLERYAGQFINDKNRSLYHAVYFRAHLTDTHEDLNGLLKTVAVMLNGEIGDVDILARIDDGFFLLKSISDGKNIGDWADETVKKLDEKLKELAEYSSAVISAGIYSLGVHDRDMDKLISDTQYCSRLAWKSGKTYALYSKKAEKTRQEENTLRDDLKTAFDKDQFTAYLQFFVDARDERILGAEALSRWNHPAMGVLSPERYIELLESENQIDLLDFTVLRRACETLQEVCVNNHKDFFIACNFSRNTIVLPDFAERIEQTLQGFTFPRECLLVELTEYAQIKNTELLFGNIESVKKLGVQVVIDDFGSGFTDLIDIGKFPFNGVKLDKSLIDGEHTEADDIVLHGLVDLMHRLGMTVIAEGIETKEQSVRLLDAGCRVIQGYYYYIPLPKSEALRVLFKE